MGIHQPKSEKPVTLISRRLPCSCNESPCACPVMVKIFVGSLNELDSEPEREPSCSYHVTSLE